jgi:LL-diaminopimelate aminotransferase
MRTAEDFAKNFFANRIGGENFSKTDKIYKFEKIKRAKRAVFTKYLRRIFLDMGVGEPDEMADTGTIEVLFREAQQVKNRGNADNGCDEFQEATAKYTASMFNVFLDADIEIFHSIGSKAALSMLPLCFVNESDTIVATTAGYSIFAKHPQHLGADVEKFFLLKENNHLPEIEKQDEKHGQKRKLCC